MVNMTEPKPARLEPGVAAAPSIIVEQTSTSSMSRIERMTDALGGRRAAFAAATGTLVTALWITLFTIGLSVPSAPYRERLLQLASPQAAGPYQPGIVESVVVIAFAYTPTNLAMLCIISALTGCLGHLATTNDAAAERARHRRIRFTVVSETPATGGTAGAEPGPAAGAVTTTETSTEREMLTGDGLVSPLAPAITAVTWGFFIYLIILSGTVVLAGDPFKDTSPEQYLRMAGSASLLAFAVGWQPQILTQLVSNIGTTRLLKPS